MSPQIRSYLNALLWTVALTAFYLGLHYVPLPTVVPFLEKLGELKGKFLSLTNILALGLTPVISGFFYAEILSLILKPFSRWRLEGTAGRQKLNQFAWALTLFIAFIQAWGSSYLIESYVAALDPSPGFLFHLVNITALMAGTFLAVWLARLITQLGVGNGFLILALATWLKKIFTESYKQVTAFWKAGATSDEKVSWLFGLVLLFLSAVFLWKFIQRGPKVLFKRPDGKRIWYEISPFPPSAGIHYYSILFLSTIAALATLWHAHFSWLTKGWPHIILEILLIVLLGRLFYKWLWGDIDVFGLAVGELPAVIRKREKILERQTKKAMLVLILGSFLFWVPYFGGNDLITPFGIVGFGILIEIFALLQDLRAQWLFWREYGAGVEMLEMDNVHLAGCLKGLFHSEGIPCHIQAYGYRRLFFIFAPLNKMRLLVPEERLESAKALLSTVQYQVV